MKVTIEVDDDLLARAEKLAREKNCDISALANEGLQRVIEHSERLKKLPPLRTCPGELTEEAKKMTWTEIINASYER